MINPENDRCWMRRAIELSARGVPLPNPHVGCVLVKNNQVVGEGWHDMAGGPHAEAVALAEAGGDAHGSTAYVTLEPCRHQGKTPPCTHALVSAGIQRVVVANRDPNPVAAGGSVVLEAAGITVEFGCLAEEAYYQNRTWLTAIWQDRPYVVAKLAMTLDGRVATANRQAVKITGEESQQITHALRQELGAVLVGQTTAQNDNPQLNVRFSPRRQPLRLVLDARRSLPSSLRLFDASAPSKRVVNREFAYEKDIAVEGSGRFLNLDELMDQLWALGQRALLVEGGSSTVASFFDATLVNELWVWVAPKVLGEGIPMPWGGMRGIGFGMHELEATLVHHFMTTDGDACYTFLFDQEKKQELLRAISP